MPGDILVPLPTEVPLTGVPTVNTTRRDIVHFYNATYHLHLIFAEESVILLIENPPVRGLLLVYFMNMSENQQVWLCS